MLLTLDKFNKRISDMESFRYKDLQSIFPLTMMEDSLGNDIVHTKCPDTVEGKDVQKDEFFVGRDAYCWLQKKVTLPSPQKGHQVVGVFDFGKTGGGFNSAFESLLYVDKKPYQGVDTFHNDVYFQDCEGKTVDLTFLLWTGLEGGGPEKTHFHQLKRAELGYLHLDTDSFYYYMKAITGALEQISENEMDYQALTELLNQALLLINWDEDAFYQTIGDALSFLEEGLEKIGKKESYKVFCVGHTHIDVAWLWRLKHTREKAIRSFSSVLHLMNEFDDYVFLQSQPQLYKYIKSDYPEIYEKIKARISEGKWEADGGMWLEADCNISSGEALVRQFLHGCHFLEEEFGVKSKYLWLPDVFGYSWALPQILKQCGIDTFITTKISWNQYNRMPHDLFQWKGLDGSKVLTYFMTTPVPGTSEQSFFATYNGMLTPETVTGSWKKYRDKAVHPEVLIAYGYGDGGGGVTRDMLKMRRAMDKVPGLPAVKEGRVDDFVARAHENSENTKSYVHTWDGELYLEYHRGTYTSQAKNKKWNRKLELKLSETEWFSSMGLMNRGAYPAEVLKNGWETVLRNQFHDIIPGSSIREVYEDSTKEYEQVDSDLNQKRAEVFSVLTKKEENTFTVFNFGSFSKTEAVFFPVTKEGVFKDREGNTLLSQPSKDGYWVELPILPLSAKTVTFSEATAPENQSAFTVSLENREISSKYYTVRWNESGHFVSVYDKENSKEVLAGDANVLEIFEDKPIKYDAWDIDIFYDEKKDIIRLSEPVTIVEEGAVRTVLRFAYTYHLSHIVQDVIFYADNRRIDFVTTVDWQETQKLLKAAFPVNVRSVKASYDIQYGHVERPTHFNTSWDYARFEVVGHKWADLSETNYGVSLLNDCKYGYNIRENVMKISLLKSAIFPDVAADKGEQTFTYAILPHTGSVTQGDTIQEGAALNIPSVVTPGSFTLSEKSFFAIDNQDIYIDAVKKAEKEDAIILRIHECRGGSSVFSIQPSLPMKGFVECNLLEENSGDWMKGEKIQGEIKPFEIKTYKILFS